MKLGLALVGILTPTVYGAQSHTAFVGPSAASMVSMRRQQQQHIAAPAVGGQVWGAWCQTTATSRRHQQLLWAAAESKDETEEAAEETEEAAEEEKPEEVKELTPEEKARQDVKDEIKALEAELVGLRNKLADGQDRLKTVGKEGYMRMAAEVDTYKRRRGESLNYVRDEAVRESLAQMVTPFEAVEALEPRFAGVTDEAQLKILNGFSGLGRGFITKLEKLGLKTIVPEVGSPLDSGKHMVAERVVGGETDNVILSVEARGYEVNGRVVRPAEVKVSVTEATLAAEAEAAKDAAPAEEEKEAGEEEEDALEVTAEEAD